jgi:hypothetical protein
MPIEFQIKLDAKDAEKEVYYRIEKWNERKTPISDILFYAQSKSRFVYY